MPACLQVLAGDIHVVLGNQLVDLRQHSGHILMDVCESMTPGSLRRLKHGKIDAGGRASRPDVVDDPRGDKPSDILLGFRRRTADVRRQDDIFKTSYRAEEFLFVACGFLWKDIQRSATTGKS